MPNWFEPGPIALFGSGETSPSGQKIFDQLFRRLPASPRVTILETPAGFELNSPRVAGRVGEFLEHRLQNYNPRVSIVPARRRDTPFSPDEPTNLEPILRADLIFMGPGSPSYTVRQLQDSLAFFRKIPQSGITAEFRGKPLKLLLADHGNDVSWLFF